MKRILLTLAVSALIATSVQAAPSLGWWDEGAYGATHQKWEFTSVSGANAYPEQDTPDLGADWITVRGGTIDGGAVIGSPDIVLDVFLRNYPSPNTFKEIWVDLGIGAGTVGTGVDAPYVGVAPGYSWVSLAGSAPHGTGTSFGFRIYPNPDLETISITIKGAAAGARLDWVHIDTICVPAPGAVLLTGLGAGLVGWLRRRRSL